MNSLGVMMSAATIGSTIFLIFAVREFARVGHMMLAAVLGGHVVGDVRGGLDQVEAELAGESLVDDFHVQQTQEAAAEAEA